MEEVLSPNGHTSFSLLVPRIFMMDQVPETPESRAEEDPGTILRSRGGDDTFGGGEGFHRQESEDEIDDSFLADHNNCLPHLDTNNNNHYGHKEGHNAELLLVLNDKKTRKDPSPPTDHATPPETPDVSDGSSTGSSASYAMIGSKRQQEQTPPQPQQRLLDIAYNPFSSHSPNSRRRTYHQTLTSSYNRHPEPQQQSKETALDMTRTPRRMIDSERSLEETSNEIRRKLWQQDMLELAAHAEKAAEAGQEHFSAYPCLYQPDIATTTTTLSAVTTVHAHDKTSPAPRMNRSVSETGAIPPQPRSVRRRRRTISWSKEYPKPTSSASSSYRSLIGKLSVVELRDVHEVFPPFPNFHTNLRTHMFRNQVTPLLFEEQDANEPSETSVAAVLMCRSADTPRRSPNNNNNTPKKNAFQNTLFKRWGGKPKRGSGVGERVSAHLASNIPLTRPQISIPPGLDEVSAIEISTKEVLPRNNRIFKVTSPYVSMTPEKTETLALADTESFEEQSSMNQQQQQQPQRDLASDGPFLAFSTPIMSDRSSRPKSNSIIDESSLFEANGPDFVTPMRLRSIRRFRASASDQHLLASLMLPANSISEDSPMRKPQHKMAHHASSSSSSTSMQTVLDVSDSLVDSSTILLPNYEESSSSASSTTIDEQQQLVSKDRTRTVDPFPSPRGKLNRRSLCGPEDVIIAISPQGATTDRSFPTSQYTFLDHNVNSESMTASRVLPVNRFRREVEDSLEIRTSATADEPIQCWSHHPPLHHDNVLTKAFGQIVPMHDNFTTTTTFTKREPTRPLYVRASDNDDFLNNFLYCSKSELLDHEKDMTKEGCEPCNDTGFACGEPNGGYCCTSILNETLGVDLLFPLPPATQHRSVLRLASTPYNAHQNKDPENSSSNWFRFANQQFDAAIDSFIGTVDPNIHRFNWSFRAPTLRKGHTDQRINDLVEFSDEDYDDDDREDERKFEDLCRFDLEESP